MDKETKMVTPPSATQKTKEPESKFQRVIIEVAFNDKNAELWVKHDPLINGIDRHKVNYGVPKNQAAALKLAHHVRVQLEKEGFMLADQK